MWNLKDRSAFFRPLLDISLSDDLGLEVCWTFKTGRHTVPYTALGRNVQVYQSEFDGSADYGGVCLKFYF